MTSQLAVERVNQQVWRVGYLPEPWTWPSWQYSTDGRFTGRWDDRDGNFRTMYAGSTLLGCLLEVLADFRPDTSLALDLADIDDNGPAGFTTAPAGELSPDWLRPRAAATARLTGTYCLVTHSATIAALRPKFLAEATSLRLTDFDASALKDARPRALTQAVATHLYETTDIAGVQFQSRHGDEQVLWAIFERPDDEEISPLLQDAGTVDLHAQSPDLLEAFRIFDLHWAGS